MNRSLLCASLLALAALAGCSKSEFHDPNPQVTVAVALRAAAGGAKSSGAAATAQSTGTGWAPLRGIFKFKDAPPTSGAVSTAGKDAAVCGQQVPNQSLEVDSASRGIANVVIYARKVSRVFKDDKKSDEKKAAGPKIFDQRHCLFLSHVMAVRTKVDKIEVKNSDPISHNTSISPPGNDAINPLLPPNGSVDYTFNRQLIVPVEVTCSIHPWMKAYLLARDDPYFAVTGKDGSFEIANLPAGEDIEFQVWHERAPGGGLEAKPGWSKGRFRLKLTADKPEDLQTIEVPPAAFQ